MRGCASLGCLLIASASCNQFYGLDDTAFLTADARFRGCPGIGESPAFVTIPTAFTSGNFPFDYTFDEARTFAVANLINTGIVEGPLDSQDFTPIDLARDSGDFFDSPRLAPEGDQLFIVVRNSVNQWSLRIYTRAGPFAWIRGATVAQLEPAQQISTPTRRAGGRRMIRRDMFAQEFIEYAEAEAGTTWSEVGRYNKTVLGVNDPISDPQLSPDGLRLVFTVNEIVGRPIYYADRATLDAPFENAREVVRLSGDAEPQHPILTQDCVRLYFVVFPGVTYVEQ